MMNLDEPYKLAVATRDVDEYVDILSRLHAPSKAEPVNREKFSMRLGLAITGGLCASKFQNSTTVNLSFPERFDGYSVSLVASGTFEAAILRGRVLQAASGEGLVIDSKLVQSAIVGDDLELPRISVTTDMLHGRLFELTDEPVVRRIQFRSNISSGSPFARTLSTLTALVLDVAGSGGPLLKFPAALQNLRDTIISLILEGVPNSYSEIIRKSAPAPAPRHIRRAMDYILFNAAKPLRIGDIALEAGVSVRTLQAGFLHFRGVTPMAYARNVRLSGARGDLLSAKPGTKISDVAHAWGFFHLSSFSTRYFQSFGELPSQTLRRGTPY